MNTDTPGSKSPDQCAGDGKRDWSQMQQPEGMTVERGDFSASFNLNGDLTLINAGGIQVTQFRAGIHDRPLAGLWLRRHREGRIDSIQLTGSGSPASLDPVTDSPLWEGRDLGVRWRVRLLPSAISPVLSRALPSGGESGGSGRGASWTWEVSVTIDQSESTAVSERRELDDAILPDDLWDLVSAQDLALVEPSMAAGAESYISQYIAYHAQDDPSFGSVLSARQTMGCAPRLPLYVTGISQGCRAFMTDGYNFYGLGARLDGQPAALGHADWDREGIDQYEFAMACLLSHKAQLTQGGLTWQVWNTALSDYRGDLGKACAACAEASGVSRSGDNQDWGETNETEADDGPSTSSNGTSPASPAASQVEPATSLLISSTLLNGDPLPEGEFNQLGGGPILQPETDQTGRLLSYFGDDACHVVGARKELEVDRSHGQILLSGNPDIDPSQPTMAATTYAGGVFASQVVLGNTNMNQLISVRKTDLGLLRSRGVRILVQVDGTWRLLGVPSAYIMDLGGSSWVYRLGGRTLTVSTIAHLDRAAIDIHLEADSPIRALLTISMEDPSAWLRRFVPADDARGVGKSVFFAPAPGSPAAERRPGLRYVISSPDAWAGDDGPLFEPGAGGHVTDPGMVTFLSDGGRALSVTIVGSMDGGANEESAPDVATQDWTVDSERDLLHAHYLAMTSFMQGLHVAGQGRFAEFNDLLPWLVQNALVHFLSPHGLEQYGGAAWGTRDVCQGPLELALAFGHADLARTILLKVFAHQNLDGSLPQWFMFDEYSDLYQHDSHGDIPVWPLLALSEYVEAGGRLDLLDEPVAFWGDDAVRPSSTLPTVADHLARTLDYIQSHRVPGTDLFCYGEGDWDDTLQPAQETMKRQMASTWTVALLYQACCGLQPLLEAAGRTGLASRFAGEAGRIKADFADNFIFQGTLAGYVNFVDVQPHPVIHPSDTRTGIRYRLIPMTRSIIAGLLTPDQEADHERIIEGNLHYPDGVRLMDRPASFHDGVTRVFKRAEQAANVGREIGLMYTHAHVRYAEALGLLGRTRLGQELLRISPVGQFRRLPTSEPRQRNCYFASSDADFPDRYTAASQWSRLKEGARNPVGVRGGWRVYSSGPGIYCRQVVQHLFGIQLHDGRVVFDPVLSQEDDGLEVTMTLFGQPRTIRYHVAGVPVAGPGGISSKGAGSDRLRVEADGRRIEGRILDLPYRRGGLDVDEDQFADAAHIDIFLTVDGQTVR